MSNENKLGIRKGQERELQSNYLQVGAPVLVFMGCASGVDQGDITGQKIMIPPHIQDKFKLLSGVYRLACHLSDPALLSNFVL